jgi:hypothetical protein
MKHVAVSILESIDITGSLHEQDMRLLDGARRHGNLALTDCEIEHLYRVIGLMTKHHLKLTAYNVAAHAGMPCKRLAIRRWLMREQLLEEDER